MSGITRITTPHTYSSAVVAGDYVFLALHRGGGDTFSAQFEDTMKGLKGTLAQLGLTMENVVKVNVWLKDVNDLPEMEQLFRDHCEPGKFPARMTATTQFFDADCLLMIDGVAYSKK
ncbi:MAG: RidA family protein [Chloroflexi bacterium]|nr:RidA family protein [Chloroflexota bacterium]